jgi:hypothetical protein
MNPIIFLDFDGVLTNQHTDWKTFDPECVKHLKRIIDETNADIVISSSWRLNMTTYGLQKLFEPYELQDKVIGTIPELEEGVFMRGKEIKKWLDNNPTDNFVILDDDDDMEPLKHKWVQTNFEVGLTEEGATKAIEMLK